MTVETIDPHASDAPARFLAARRLPEIVEPGVYDIAADVYHRDPVPGGSLSSTGARRIIDPGCPALFHYERTHGTPPSTEFDIGTAAHTLVLGTGPELVVIEADNWKTAGARADRDDARAEGSVALLPHEYAQVQAMAAEIRRHPIAKVLFDPSAGTPERSLFWTDDQTGVNCRARIDWLPDERPGRMAITDYKSTRKADLASISRTIQQFGYHQQGDFYTNGALALGLAEDVVFVFVFQEKTPPYIVTVVELDGLALQIGAHRNRLALETYARCTAEDRWPGYSDDIEMVGLPAWAENEYLREES